MYICTYIYVYILTYLSFSQNHTLEICRLYEGYQIEETNTLFRSCHQMRYETACVRLMTLYMKLYDQNGYKGHTTPNVVRKLLKYFMQLSVYLTCF